MNRIGIAATTAIGLLLLLATASMALAKENESRDDRGGGSVSAQVQVNLEARTRGDSDSDNSTSTKRNDVDDDQDDDADDDVRATTSVTVSGDDDFDDDDNGGKGEGEKHRSAVADVVLSLRALADRDGGIGDEVREVAREQASSSEHIAEAMAKVEARGALMTFLFGADFKNIGELRSELATTQNHIRQLTEARSGAVSADVKAGIDAQITALQKANADASAFVQAHEETFSIFGWFARLFGR
ncbi:MAG: hypothetical protein AAB790_01925 [Patescibacteria group bacterium]